ncbi:pilus assembly protein [Kineosporia sp. J2-2]|uniref:Pilus assembly protein n=1 Tax=Kineosporia corallincola TaxID=2835133 RepID=A0ABS5TQ55_9ACTN|nr:pilus assembly protein TadG-related protein [Kineosporia corallincola]MBT0773242.1 pilus assembly protein [Kineosporia corallincola]
MIRGSGRDDRGSVSLFAVVVVVALLVATGLVVDGGGMIAAQQRAQSTAREAARQGGQQLQASLAVRGIAVRIDSSAAEQAARTWLAAADVDGSASVQGGDTVVVDTSTTYSPIFLNLIGVGTRTVTGHAESRVARTVDGAAQ